MYAAEAYRTELTAHGMLASMSGKGDCYDCEHTSEHARRSLTPSMTDLVSLR